MFSSTSEIPNIYLILLSLEYSRITILECFECSDCILHLKIIFLNFWKGERDIQFSKLGSRNFTFLHQNILCSIVNLKDIENNLYICISESECSQMKIRSKHIKRCCGDKWEEIINFPKDLFSNKCYN